MDVLYYAEYQQYYLTEPFLIRTKDAWAQEPSE